MASTCVSSAVPSQEEGNKRRRRRWRHSNSLLRCYFDDGKRALASSVDVFDNRPIALDDEEQDRDREVIDALLDRALCLLDEVDYCSDLVGRVKQRRRPVNERRLFSRRHAVVCWTDLGRGKVDGRLRPLARYILCGVVEAMQLGCVSFRSEHRVLPWLPAGRRSAKVFLEHECVQGTGMPQGILKRCSETFQVRRESRTYARPLAKVCADGGGKPAPARSCGARRERVTERARPVRRPRPPPAEAGDSAAVLRYELKENAARQTGLSHLLVSLQHRDITAEDYELLLELDASVAPKTVSESQLASLPVQHLVDDDACVKDDSFCSVCMMAFCAGEATKTLPCKHRFHDVCIDRWLSLSSICCPLDGLPVFS